MRLTLVVRAVLSKSVHKTPSKMRVLEEIESYSRYHPSGVNLKQFVEFAGGKKQASEEKSFLFLRKELPVRLANIMKEINLLPEHLLKMQSVELVQSWYLQSFEEILQFETSDANNQANLKNFCEVVAQIRNRHSNVVETMAQGVMEMRERHWEPENKSIEAQIQYFLDRFYMSRISIRMLINQHVLLFGSELPNNSKLLGSIDPKCDVLSVAQDAFENARFLCEQYYLTSPDCRFECVNSHEENSKVQLCYVPSHLYHMLFEIFKNSLRAVVEFHGEDADSLPELRVQIVKGHEDLSIKICDQGGGIRRTLIDNLFNYMYSTAPRPASPQAASSTPLAGYGYGLPLSRLYAKYFNGDLSLSTVEGYGTDAYIYLKVFPSDASELLPVYNKTASNAYTKSIPVGDWSDPSQTTGLHGAVHSIPKGGQSRSFSSRIQTRRYSTLLSQGPIIRQSQQNLGLSETKIETKTIGSSHNL